MGCKDLGEHDQCLPGKDETNNIENAGLNVGMDLCNPVDLSQMDVYQISSEAEFTDYGQAKVKRRTILHTYVINDHNEREELTIMIELESSRRPKIKAYKDSES